MSHTLLTVPFYCLGIMFHILIKCSPIGVWVLTYLFYQDFRSDPNSYVEWRIRRERAPTDDDRRRAHHFMLMWVALLIFISIMLLYAVGDVPEWIYARTAQLLNTVGTALSSGWGKV